MAEHQAVIRVLDGDRAVRDALRALLTSHGFPVSVHTTGAELLAAVREGGSSLVVLDVHAPDCAGLHLLADVRAHTPVLALMDHATPTLAEAARAAGASDLLEKPFTAEEFVSAVKRALAAGH
jgi:two-component system response regulator FixJ